MLAALAGAVAAISRVSRRTRSTRVTVSARAELLVDGDSHAVADMQRALELLEEEGHTVQVTVFGPPKYRSKSTECQEFLRKLNVAFRPALRLRDKRGEATDEAIHATIGALMRAKDVDSIALLTSDKGFLPPLQECIARGTCTKLFIPDSYHSTVEFYKANKQHVHILPSTKTSPTVRALLHDDGSGSVTLAEPYVKESYDASLVSDVLAVLEDRGSKGGKDTHWVQQVVKTWFGNSLGTLTVWPAYIAMATIAASIRSSSWQQWDSFDDQLAFILPIGSPGGRERDVEIYGSRLARCIFQGGGPFMLGNSASLVSEVLTKLGYLDDELNADLSEAMFCFINSANNKMKLRKLKLLPRDGAFAPEVSGLLQKAFLSNDTDGRWKIGPRSTPSIKGILKRAGLPRSESREELFAAMRLYARRYNLPRMKTFNGLAWRIMRLNSMNPERRGGIEIAGSR